MRYAQRLRLYNCCAGPTTVSRARISLCLHGIKGYLYYRLRDPICPRSLDPKSPLSLQPCYYLSDSVTTFRIVEKTEGYRMDRFHLIPIFVYV